MVKASRLGHEKNSTEMQIKVFGAIKGSCGWVSAAQNHVASEWILVELVQNHVVSVQFLLELGVIILWSLNGFFCS